MLSPTTPHALRLSNLLAFVRQVQREGQAQLQPATWYAVHRHERERAPVGCIFGHFVAATRPGPISLEPVRWKAQLKAAMLQTELLQDYPMADWHHYTLHYRTDAFEAFGLGAAALYLRIKPQLASHLFAPHQSYERSTPIASLAGVLTRITGEEDPCTQSSLRLSDLC